MLRPDPAAPDGPAKPSTASPPPTYTIKVNGADKVVTLDEALVLAQKGAAADEKFQEAAQMRKETEKQRRIVDNLTSLRKGFDETAFRSLAADMDMDPSEVEQTIADFRGAAPDKNAATPPSSPGVPERRPVAFADLDDEMKRWAADVEKERQDRDIRRALEKDEVLKYYTSKSPDALNELMDLTKAVLQRRVAVAGGRVVDRTRLLEDTVSEVRTMLKKVGTLVNPTPHTGLGPAASSDSPDLYPSKAPERVSATSPEYERYLTKKLGHMFRQLGETR